MPLFRQIRRFQYPFLISREFEILVTYSWLRIVLDRVMLTPKICSSPYAISVTIRHNENPVGNPDSKPVTFDLSDTGLTVVGGGEDWQLQMYPWLLLHHDPSALEGGLKEIESESEGHGPADMFEGEGDDGDAEPQVPEVRPENGFVTLAVGETKTFEVQWEEPGRLVEEGERYRLCFRGTFLRWWKWGTMEEMKGAKKTEQDRETTERMWIACTNVVELTVKGS